MRSSACGKRRQVIKGVKREASRRCLKRSRHKERGVVLGGGKSQWMRPWDGDLVPMASLAPFAGRLGDCVLPSATAVSCAG
jgi:anti-sigma factor RsiW